MLTSSVVVVGETTKGSIISIRVRGEWPEGRGDDLPELVAVALADYDPHSVVIDLRETKGTLCVDTLGGLIPILVRKREDAARSFCIVAGGHAAKGLRWLLTASKASRYADVAVFTDIKLAIDHLRPSGGLL